MTNKPLLIAVAVAVLGASIALWAQLRKSGDPAPAAEVDTPAADPAPETRPPPSPELPKPERRPPIATRPAARAIRPRVESSAGGETGGDDGADPKRAEARELVRKASNAYANERYAAALKYAEVALESDEGSVLARSVAVLSACAIGRKDVATAHAARLDERRRQPLMARCLDEHALEIDPK